MKKLFLIMLIILQVFNVSCNEKKEPEINLTFEEVNFNLFKDYKIYVFKPSEKGQMLSVVLKNKNDDIVVFDGGRMEDEPYLHDFIVANGGIVKYWFVTHTHDDHIGALYALCLMRDDIYIENICYNIPDYEWLKERVGDDAYIKVLFEQGLDMYQTRMLSKNKKINIINDLKKGDVFNLKNLNVNVLNTAYTIDNDPINNSSIVYKANIENTSMIVLGDLGYYGGEKLLKETDKESIKADIVVMAHHGQDGVDKPVYEMISPSICIWPTTKYIYENKEHKYKTDETKQWIKDLGIKNNIIPIEKSFVIK